MYKSLFACLSPEVRGSELGAVLALDGGGLDTPNILINDTITYG